MLSVMLPPATRPVIFHRVWITRSVSTQSSAMEASTFLRASPDNRMHSANKHPTVLFKLIWIHRMPSVVRVNVNQENPVRVAESTVTALSQQDWSIRFVVKRSVNAVSTKIIVVAIVTVLRIIVLVCIVTDIHRELKRA